VTFWRAARSEIGERKRFAKIGDHFMHRFVWFPIARPDENAQTTPASAPAFMWIFAEIAGSIPDWFVTTTTGRRSSLV
jgi:hypothetical protein